MLQNDLLEEEKPQIRARVESGRLREKETKAECEINEGKQTEARIYEQEKVKLNSFGQEMILSN